MAESFQTNAFQNNSFDVTAGGAVSHERSSALEAVADITSAGTFEESPAGEHARQASFDMVADVAARGHTSIHVRAVSLTALADFTTVVAAYKVQDLVAVAVSSSSIHLTWDDTALTDEVYDIERDGEVFLTNYDGTSYTDTGLDPGTTYTYRVRANGTTSREGSASFSAFAFIEAEGFSEVPEFEPSTISGLEAWWDFSLISTLWQDAARTTAITTDGQVILGVTDRSGNGNHLGLSVGGVGGPTYKTAIFNGRSVARFDGTDDGQALSTLATVQPFTIFLVYKSDTAAPATANKGLICGEGFVPLIDLLVTSNVLRFYAGSGANSSIALDTNQHAIGGRFNGASSSFYIDGSVASTGNPGAGGFGTDPQHRSGIGVEVSDGGFAVGNTFFDGDILEILIYDSSLSNTDLNLVGNYLERWGLTWTDV